MRTIPAVLDLLPENELWWIVAAGGCIATLAFLLGTRLLQGRGPLEQTPDDPLNKFPIATSDPERRQARRRKGSSVTVQVTDLDKREKSHSAWVVDRSVGGLGLWVDRSAEKGTQVKVRPEHTTMTTPWIEVEVVDCKPHEGGWRWNCSFVKTPPYSVLLLLG